MLHLDDYSDERNRSFCPQCGREQYNRDHVPSKILLDEPYPANLPFVSTCLGCNQDASLDEEYTACFIECVINGSVDPENAAREKIARILQAKPALRARIEKCRIENADKIYFTPERQRIERVLIKLARGHAAYELAVPQLGPPSVVSVFPLMELTHEMRDDFEIKPMTSSYPEVGCRAMQRLFIEDRNFIDGWVVVQNGRYRYMAIHEPFVEIRIVLSEYLGCRIAWEDEDGQSDGV